MSHRSLVMFVLAMVFVLLVGCNGEICYDVDYGDGNTVTYCDPPPGQYELNQLTDHLADTPYIEDGGLSGNAMGLACLDGHCQ